MKKRIRWLITSFLRQGFQGKGNMIFDTRITLKKKYQTDDNNFFGHQIVGPNI